MEETLAGHVKSVRVEAFKCHDHFEVEFGCVNILTLQTEKGTSNGKSIVINFLGAQAVDLFVNPH